jgi:tetratricopeptide (TPR) repeat protein
MGSFNGSRFQFPAPTNASDFEDLCLSIFQCVWQDNTAQKNGRSGQAQNGVDIFGTENGKLVAVQCKKKDLSLNSKLTKSEILAEVKLAVGFDKDLSKLIIATTDARDIKIQKYARELSKKYKKEAGFSVVLQAWEDLTPRIGQYREKVMLVHYPEFIQTESDEDDETPEQKIKSIDSGSLEAKSSQSIDGASVGTDSGVIQPTRQGAEAILDEYNREVDRARDLIEANRYSDALNYLLELKDTMWNKADDILKFRLLTNIASCQTHLGETTEAASNFFQAYELNPNEDKAKSNRAYAFLLSGQYQEAADAAKEMIDINPMHVTAFSIYIQALGYIKETYKEILNLVPEKLQSKSEIIYALANVAKRLGEHEESTKLLSAVASSSENDPEALGYLAAEIIEKVISANKLSIRGNLAPEYRDQLLEAINMIKKAWKLIPDKEDRKHVSFMQYNMATAYRLRGELNEAQKSLDELLELEPDKKEYKILSASIAYDSKDYATVKEVMTELSADKDANPEATLRLAEADIKLGNEADAISALQNFIKTYNKRDLLWEDAHYYLIDVLFTSGKTSDASWLVDDFEKSGAKPMIVAVMRAKIARATGKIDDAKTLLEQAFSMSDLSNPTEWLIEIAQEAYDCKDYTLAAKAYAAAIDPRTDTMLTRRYLHSLYESSQFKKVIEIAESLREQQGSKRDITQFEWAAYQELQDLPHAKEVLSKHIADNPTDDDAKLRLALIDFRSDNLDAVDKYLENPIDVNKLDVFSGVQLANLCQLRGNADKTLEVLYELRRTHPSEADAHSAYASLFLGLDDDLEKIDLSPKQAEADTVILYKGGHILIEGKFEPDIQKDEITVDEAKRRGLIGKKKGDKIVISENPISGPQEVKISNIQSKYVFAFQETLKNYEKRFRDRTDLMGLPVRNDDITPILKQLDQSHDHTRSVETFYKEGKLTIDTFAKLLNKSYFQVIYGLQSIADAGIRTSTGMTEEREDADSVLSTKPILVADISALVTLFEVGVTHKDLQQKPRIAQSVRDFVKEEIAKSSGFGRKKGMTLYKSNGKYFRQEITKEENERWLAKLKDLENWLDENTQIEPIDQDQLDTFNQKQERLGELLGKPQVDSITLAIGENRVFLADDLMLRMLAKSISVNGVWTQALLLALAQEALVGDKTYIEATMYLASHNYHHILVNPALLMAAAEKSKWLPEEPFTSMLRAVTRKETTLQSLSIVIINFLYEFYKKPIPVDKTFVVQHILNEVNKNHDMDLFIAGMKAGIEMRFQLLPNCAKEIKDTIDTWSSLHNL